MFRVPCSFRSDSRPGTCARKFKNLHRAGLSGLLSHQWSGGEINAEAATPDGYRPILIEIYVHRQLVVLVTHIALEVADADKPGLRDGLVVLGVGSCDQIDLDIGAVGSFEAAEA